MIIKKPQFTQEQINKMAPGEIWFYDRVGWETNAEDISMSYRYDVFYNNKTGEIVEEVCACEPGTCEFTDAWISDGKPTHIPMDEFGKHKLDGPVINI